MKKITNIISNGSKWMGESPDPIKALEKRLKEIPLNRTFEEYGNFAYKSRETGLFHIWGNFLSVSAVFNIETTDTNLFGRLKKLIRANQKRPDYKSQLIKT